MEGGGGSQVGGRSQVGGVRVGGGGQGGCELRSEAFVKIKKQSFFVFFFFLGGGGGGGRGRVGGSRWMGMEN